MSIGSLYQYYPSKEALVAAVVDRHHRELMQVVRDALAGVAALPLEAAVRRLVTVAIEAHRIDPRLHRVVAEQIPRTGRLENVGAFNRETYALFRAYLEDHRDEIRAVDLGLAAFVCVTSIEALTHTAVLHRPDILADEAAVHDRDAALAHFYANLLDDFRRLAGVRSAALSHYPLAIGQVNSTRLTIPGTQPQAVDTAVEEPSS